MSAEDAKTISTTLENLKLEHKELKATTHAISADIVNIKNDISTIIQVAKRLDVGLLGDPNLNHDGLFKQVQNQCIKHEKLDARVTIIENLKSTEDVLTKYKKGLFGVIFINAGVAILWVVEKILTFVHIN